MKKIVALLLAVLAIVGMFAACGDNNANATPTNPVTTDAPETTEPATTEAPAQYINATKLSKHENGWCQDMFGNGSHGVFFNMFANDLPYGDGWDVEYMCVSDDVIMLVRDGETIAIGNDAGYGLVKFDKSEYYLKLDEWILPDGIFPIRNGDMIIVSGDFHDPKTGWTIHFDPVYMTFDSDLVKFHTEDPRN